jgi:CheY-like chemotaxis protein
MLILVADDDPVIQRVIKTVLLKAGHRVLQALDGLEALALFRQEAPDLVLTDYHMPGLNGIELCRQITQERGTRFVPVLMLTSGQEDHLLAESLAAGAMEFITKPIGIEELRCRVEAVATMTAMHQALATAQEHAQQENSLVKHLLERLTKPGLAQMPGSFAMETHQTERVNGDACAYTSSWNGAHLGLLCDATGHGLVAGVSTIPVVDTFLAMASRDISLKTIYQSVNTKLLRLLPVGRFVCLLLIRIDPQEGVLEVLNAGMPDLLLHRKGTEDLRYFASQNLPAGVSPLAQDIRVDEVGISPGDRLFMYSDGLGDLLSDEIIASVFLTRSKADSLPMINERLRKALRGALGNDELNDDLTWGLWEIPQPAPLAIRPKPHAQEASTRLGFRQSFELDPRHQEVKAFVPDLLGFLGFRGVPETTTPLLGMMLTEGLTNAVDHGLLGLDSRLKQEGFETYEAARHRALEALTGGRVRLVIGFHYRFDAPAQLNHLEVAFEDDGPGFDWRPWLQTQVETTGLPFGRGIALLLGLSSHLSFNEQGNRMSFTLPVE